MGARHNSPAVTDSTLRPLLVGEVEGRFVVPAYQRGFRWGTEEVSRLLDDIDESQGPYYLQPVVLKPRGDNEWELVDGQQRFTTLHLIYSYIRRHVPTVQARYSLEYATRPNSAEFLASPTADGSSLNVDFYFIFQAWTYIESWFEAKADPVLAAMNFYRALGERVYVIWYEAPADTDSRTLFTRLNVGRIPLTDAELVKAVLLSRVERREEVAAQWDSIERDFRSPELWAFVTGDRRQLATHISLLLNALAERINGPAKHPLHTFESLRERMLATSPKDTWDELLDLHSLFLGWYDDHDLFHKIGYLISTGSSIQAFIDPGLELGRRDFEAFLDQRIRARLNLTRSAVTELDYETNQPMCSRVLHLMNVETVRRRGDRLHRFSFAAHASRAWSLEHVHAQSAEQLDELGQWTAWLQLHRDALLSLPAADTAKVEELVKRIDSLPANLTKEQFRSIESAVVPMFTASGSDSYGVHNISNLALLAQEDNSALSNSCFEVKRLDILKRDRDGKYIPPATRNIFLKYYTESKGQQIHFWGPHDRDGYLAALLDVLGPYLLFEEGNE